MSGTQIELQLIAVVVAVACALPGVFLVLRRMAMMSDAIGHTVLLGIVIAYFLVRDLDLARAYPGRGPRRRAHSFPRRTAGQNAPR